MLSEEFKPTANLYPAFIVASTDEPANHIYDANLGEEREGPRVCTGGINLKVRIWSLVGACAKADAQQAGIEGALDDDFEFEGQYAFGKSLPQAPNPSLRIDGIGLVNLPLSPRDAASLKEACAQAPFGRGDRTLVDKAVRDAWELDPAKLAFTNPLWPISSKRPCVQRVGRLVPDAAEMRTL